MIRIQNESNKETKQNERRQKRENTVEDIDTGRFFELATTDRDYVDGLNLHEIKDEILEDYTGDFELIGKMIIGLVEHKTNIRFKNMDDFERYINAIDIDYDSDDVIFTGYVYKLNTPQFKVVKRSAYGKGTNHMREIVEYHGQNCYISTSGMCFIKCINYFTKKDYTEEFLTFIKTEKYRSGVMTTARIQPFCKKYNINIGYFNGKEIWPRTVTQRNTALKIHHNHFCLIWKSDNVSFNQVIENELKPNFKVVDNVISDKHVKGFIKYEYNPKKVKSPLTNIVIYDLETFNKIKAVPYCSCIYKLSKLSGKYNRDISEQEYQKCLNDCVVFKGTDCINEMLDHVLSFKGEPKKVKIKIVEYDLYLIAHNGSGFDSYVVLNNLPQWRSVVKTIKNGAGIISLKIFNGYIDPVKKIPQYVHFRCGRVHINQNLRKIGESYKLQESLFKKELEHDEIYEDTYEAKENEWLPYVKNDVLSTAFCYAGYTMGSEELTEFGMKNSLTLPSLANKYFNSLRDENDEPIYTYTDPFMRNFVRKAIKGGRCNAFNQYYKSEISDEVFNIISKELNVDNDGGNVCDILEKYFEFLKKHEKEYRKEFDSKYNDYRDTDQKEKEKYVNKKLNKLPIHNKLSKLNLKKTQMCYDATSLYLSAMWDCNSVYPKIETGFAFKPHMNKTYVEAFNNQTLNEDGDESAILTIKYYNPRDLIFQHLPVKEKVKKIEVNRMRNGYIIDTLTSVDICEIVKIGGKVIEIYEGVIYRENFKVSPFRRVIEKLFGLRQKYKDEKNDSMQGLVKLIMNSLYGVQIRKDINESYSCKSETWMKTEFDENVLDYWRLPNGNYIVKMKKDDGLDDDCDIKNTLPAVLGAFILANSRRIMNKFIREVNGFYENNVYYTDTDSLYIEKKYWDLLDKANLVGDNLCQGKNDYKPGGIFYGLYLAPKIKYCLTIDEYCIIKEHKTFKGFNDSKRLLDRSQYFKMKEGEKISAMLPRSWKKSFDNGVIIPKKMRFCNKCNNIKMCDKCNNQTNENKEFEANLNLLKRDKPNDCGHMLAYYVI